MHHNVADLVDPPRVLQREMDVLTEQQVRTLLDTVKGDRLEAMIVLALATGLRAGELMALQWHDVNLDSGMLQVRRTLKRVSGGYGFGRAKDEAKPSSCFSNDGNRGVAEASCGTTRGAGTGERRLARLRPGLLQ